MLLGTKPLPKPMMMKWNKQTITLTHWGRDKMAAISQTTLSNAFSWMTMLEFRIKFHWSLFIRVQLTISQHWFRWWLGADQATSHYLNQWWLDYRRIYASLGLNELKSMCENAWGQICIDVPKLMISHPMFYMVKCHMISSALIIWQNHINGLL